MENKKYKYIKRRDSTISNIDLQILYLNENGSYPTDISAYIEWLEDKILELKKLTQKLIPFENGTI